MQIYLDSKKPSKYIIVSSNKLHSCRENNSLPMPPQIVKPESKTPKSKTQRDLVVVDILAKYTSLYHLSSSDRSAPYMCVATVDELITNRAFVGHTEIGSTRVAYPKGESAACAVHTKVRKVAAT